MLKTKRKSVRLNPYPDLNQQLKAKADQLGMSVNGVINFMLYQWLVNEANKPIDQVDKSQEVLFRARIPPAYHDALQHYAKLNHRTIRHQLLSVLEQQLEASRQETSGATINWS